VPVYRLAKERVAFPDPELAEPDGLLAVGGDLSPERLVAAYALGVFPWFTSGTTPYWFSPDPRAVLEPGRVHVSRSLRRTLRSGAFRFTADTAFERVIARCASKRRPAQRGTWISSSMRVAYERLHDLGVAHSVECWSGERLVGGLYGVSLGAMFCGESMFSDAPDASKAAFVALARALEQWSFQVIDCQVPTEHLASLGAVAIPRSGFLERVRAALQAPTRRGRWELPFDRLDG
jgi:leucyl/phenylalanyl-tRNA--protein transferase